MTTMSPNKVGIALGVLLAGWHLAWSLLVLVGWAQPLIDFIFWIHFIKPIYVIQPFNMITALILIVVTGAVGYVVGAAFAVLWNKVHQ